ncbi:MAG: hypothetical protein PGN08_01540 [Sphingomonas taxi]
MNAPTRISAEVDDATLAKIEAAAATLGISLEQFAGDALRQAADDAADLAGSLQLGRDQIARGEYREHVAFMTDLRRWRETRVRPH